ncbi:cation:proton antiporter domain-containing protein [Yunchengibacter salinarum]|uniref:cation:proton antiporter domain-containing protein n=1 Tax=Yunchengibacter salinarum TaxID=3133399 RepID=UPI0035B5B35E
MHSIPYIREGLVFLAIAGLVVPIFHRMRISPVLGYLVVGLLVGPNGLGLLVDRWPALSHVVISDVKSVQTFAELGVIFLLFVIGLELSVERLWRMRRLVFGLGGFQVVITGVIVFLLSRTLGLSASASVVVGAALSLSSTAMGVQLLSEKRQLATRFGRASFSILLFQDLAVVPILFVVSMLGQQSDGQVGQALLLALGQAVLAILLIYGGGRLLLRPLFRMVSQTRNVELFMATTLLVVVGLSVITGAAGLSMAMGGFLAGLLLSETEFVHEIKVQIEPFKGLLMGLFFLSVGMGIDTRMVLDGALPVIGGALGLLLLKGVILAVLARLYGLPRHTGLKMAFLLPQGGEFAFIISALAATLGVLSEPEHQYLLLLVGLTMLATPAIASVGQRLGDRLEAAIRPEDPAHGVVPGAEDVDEVEGHVVIAGFGRVGRTLAHVLDAENIPFVGLDTDPGNVTRARKDNLPVYYGDAARTAILEAAHVERAQALVVTLNNAEAASEIVEAVRFMAPDLPIYARARHRQHARELRDAGATMAVPETIEASLSLAARVMEGAGLTEDLVTRRIDTQRSQELL